MIRKAALVFLFFIYASNNSVGQTKSSFLSAGDKAFFKEDYSSATGFYLKALEFDDDDSYLMMQVGECNRRMFEYKTALAWFNRCLSDDKQHKNPQALLLKAETLRCLGEYDDALSAVSSYIAIDSLHNRQQAEKYIERIKSALSISSMPVDSVAVKPFGKNINTAFSDFAAIYSNDSTMLFSSLRFESNSIKEKNMISKILFSSIDSTSAGKAKILPDVINNPSWHNCNSSVSPDGKLMVFSRCNYNDANKLICALYESRFINGSWQEPGRISDEINIPGYTATQPSITTSGIEGYTMYYVSDKPGGMGLTDIYKSNRDAKGNYSKPENCGNRINTSGNEYSPFYNAVTHYLYFSSDSLSGLGGQDIFRINPDDTSATAINIGPPFNSGYNDLYYSENINKPGAGFLSSNRTGTFELSGQTCCYDIFSFMPDKIKHEKGLAAKNISGAENLAAKKLNENEISDTNKINKKESLAVKKANEEELLAVKKINANLTTLPFLDSTNVEEYLNKNLLPLKLFFDNDFPDPRSKKPSTSQDYESLYRIYFSKLENYIEGFSKDKPEEEARDAVQQFFSGDLQFNHSQFEIFNAAIYDLLKKGNRIEITVRGCASPLANSDYNLILSKRRIASVVNYWKLWNNSSMRNYLASGMIALTEEPAGESLSAPTISDRRDDLANSIYNPSASRERKIEIVRIKVSKP